jgi:hypothetical protein
MIVFTGPRLKVQRAKKHIADLNREIATYKGLNPYELVVDRDSEPGQHLLRVNERVKPPEDWPVIVGDVLHNLRSGLDILACDVLRACGRTNVRNVYFPFAKSPDTLETAIKQRRISKTRPNVVTEFRRLKPYKGGSELLYAIHELNLADKHQLLITIHQPAIARNIRVLAQGLVWNTGPSVGFRLEGERILVRVAASRNPQFDYDRHVPFEVLFDIGNGVLKPVAETLFHMAQVVSEIIETIEGHFNNPQPVIALTHQP